MARMTTKGTSHDGGTNSAQHAARGSPNYPYTTIPRTLEKVLELIPEKPKPTKVNGKQMQAWGIKDNNATTVIRVLKALGVISSSGEPTELYVQLMSEPEAGRKALAQRIREVYEALFEAEHKPYEDPSQVTRLLHVHGGTQSEDTIRHMRNTFLTLCKAADWTDSSPGVTKTKNKKRGLPPQEDEHQRTTISEPSVVINIQLTLPPGLDEEGYDAFFASMKKHLWPGK